MAWCPFAEKMELQPESDSQAAIVPEQFIVHSIAAPWTIQGMYEYWRDSTNLESHFGGGYDGSLGQYIGTETRADANYKANVRAVSIETASNLEHTDPWTDAQISTLIRLGIWLHRTHGIPLRLCRTWDDPGYGWHGMFPEWSVSGTACPGAARIRQFKEIVFPAIVAGATQEDDMPTADEVANAVWNFRSPDPLKGNVPTEMEAYVSWRGAHLEQIKNELDDRMDVLETKLNQILAKLG